MALILVEIYLNSLDSAVVNGLKGIHSESYVLKRYVDDIVVRSFQNGVAKIPESLLKKLAPELRFHLEQPQKDGLQFSDLQIHVGEGLCRE